MTNYIDLAEPKKQSYEFLASFYISLKYLSLRSNENQNLLSGQL